MRKSIVKAALLITGLTSSGYAAGVARVAPRPIPPVILSATVQFTDNRMLISGRHFGSSAPTVTLARRVLKVNSFSESEVVVDLPTGIEPADPRRSNVRPSIHKSCRSSMS